MTPGPQPAGLEEGVVALLMAAGAGRRAGGPKALRRDADGTAWLARSIAVLLDGGCSQVTVVLGAGAAEARTLVPDDPRVRVHEAADWDAGLGSSLRSGLQVVRLRHPAAVLIHLVDLPDVTAEVVRRVLAVGVSSAVLARATYDERPGHPVLVGSDHLAPLAARLRGDRGARDFLAGADVRSVPCGDLATGRDDDGPAHP